MVTDEFERVLSKNVIMAKQFDCDIDFATKAVIQSMIFGSISIPLLITAGNILLNMG